MPMRHPLPLLFFSFFFIIFMPDCDRHRNRDQNYAKRSVNANSDTRAVHHGNSSSPLAVGTPLGHMIVLYDSRLHIHSIDYTALPTPSFRIPPSSISTLSTVQMFSHGRNFLITGGVYNSHGPKPSGKSLSCTTDHQITIFTQVWTSF